MYIYEICEYLFGVQVRGMFIFDLYLFELSRCFSSSHQKWAVAHGEFFKLLLLPDGMI